MAIEFFRFPGIESVQCVFCGRDATAPPTYGDIAYGAAKDNQIIAANRRKLISLLARHGLTGWHELHQVHGTEIVVEPCQCDPFAPAPLSRADGAMTTQPGLALVIKTADCQPLLFCDASGRHIMAIHCGWRGNRANFPALAVSAFARQYKLAPEQIWAVRGPGLGPENAEFINFADEWGPEFERWHDGKTMNLWQLTRDQLTAAGIPENQIFGLDICTAAHCDAWFSYRRDHACGRQASLIWIKGAGLPCAQTDPA